MPMPKIDYPLLGEAVEFYESEGFTYIEVPWVVDEYTLRMTLPECFPYMEIGHDFGDVGLSRYSANNCLVGSAEQGFLSMHLVPGHYVGVTPCFRIEDASDRLMYQDMFMKVELFSNHPQAAVEQMIKPAEKFMNQHTYGVVKRLPTQEGIDLMHAGYEVGSYGERTHDNYGRWVFGTGLALPRFTVANALSRVV